MKFYKVTDLSLDFNNLTTKDISKIAKLVANTNSAYWDAIGWAEDLNRVFKELNAKDIERVAKAFKKLKNYDFCELIDPELYGKETQDVSEYFEGLNELFEEEI